MSMRAPSSVISPSEATFIKKSGRKGSLDGDFDRIALLAALAEPEGQAETRCEVGRNGEVDLIEAR
jgi:hypothetical protein